MSHNHCATIIQFMYQGVQMNTSDIGKTKW